MPTRFPTSVPTADMKNVLDYVRGVSPLPAADIAESAWWIAGYGFSIVAGVSTPCPDSHALPTGELHQALAVQLEAAIDRGDGLAAINWQSLMQLLLQFLPTIIDIFVPKPKPTA